MNIVELLHERAAAHPEQAAIIDGKSGRERTVTYGELSIAVRNGSALFSQKGLRAGDRVLMLYPVSCTLYAAMLGLLRIGCVPVFIDPYAGYGHIERCAGMVMPRGFVGSLKAQVFRFLSGNVRRIPEKIILCSSTFTTGRNRGTALSTADDMYRCRDGHPALITFTSGSTGWPKAIVRSHGFLYRQHEILLKTLHLRQCEIDMSTMPIFVLANLASGVISFIPDCNLAKPGFVNTRKLLEQVQRIKPDRTVASPSLLRRLSIRALRQGCRLNSLRTIHTGGAPVFPKDMRLIRKAAPQAKVIAVYGSTEAEPMAEISCDAISKNDVAAMSKGKGLLAGTRVPDLMLEIVRFDALPGRKDSARRSQKVSGQEPRPDTVPSYTAGSFANILCKPGEAGEIVVSAEHVVKGYLDGAGDSENKFEVDRVRWHRTGDAGWLDDKGRLWLLGRVSARIDKSGGPLYPFAVEAALMNNKGLRRAALIQFDGRALAALESSDPHITVKLGDYLRSLGVDGAFQVHRIPLDKRHNAKVDYPSLRRITAQHYGRGACRIFG